MARRQKADSSGIVAYFIVVIVAAILYVVSTALMLAATIAFYVTPFVLIVCVWRMHGTSASPPRLPDPAEFDHYDMTVQVRRGLGRLAFLQADLRSQHQVAKAQDVRLTKASGERRFDTRSNLGRTLNDRLDEIEKEIDELETRISFIRGLVVGTAPDWRGIFNEWRKRRSFQIAVLCSMTLSVCTLVLLLLNRSEREIENIQHVLLWTPSDWPNLGPYVGAAFLAYPMFFIARYIQYRRLQSAIDPRMAERWESFEEKWLNWNDPLKYFPPLIEEAGAEGRMGAGGTPNETVHGWATVLGVSDAAEPAEIKAAYRDLMKGYHSDRVAGLGLRLREVAEEESKKINVAYAEAKAVKGFQ